MKYVTLFFWLVALAWGGCVMLLTLSPGYMPVVHHATLVFVGDTAQALGHIGLFASLTLVLWAALRTWISAHLSLLLAMGIAIFLGTATELSQGYIPYRGATLVDLFANWLGAFFTGFSIAYTLYILEKMKSARWVFTRHS